MATIVHLVRHAEVENPDNIWYGRLDGYPLSEAGRRRALALGEYFESHTLSGIYTSPMERALETAQAIAAPHRLEHGLGIETCPDLIESASYLQGQHADRRVFLRPGNWRYLKNPFHPSWGEPYRSVAARMQRAIAQIRSAHPGGEAVAVSHMTPVMVARLAVEGRPLRPWFAGIQCDRGSVTTFTFEGDRWVSTAYQAVGGPALRG